jgi:putative transposase
MLNSIKFSQWCRSLNSSKATQALIHQIRNSNPVRAVRSFKGNVIGRYPSRKMGMTIQFESHKDELPFIYEYEHDEQVLEYYDQPSTIKLNYETVSGRHLGVLHTPDFFVIRFHSAGWEECKTEEELIELSSKNANRYIQEPKGKWRCLPGEEYAVGFGLYYHVRSSKEIGWTYQRNIEFLDDYFRTDTPVVNSEVKVFVLKKVAEEPNITLGELLKRTKEVASHDDVFMLIATDDLYVDLYAVPLTEPDNVHIFPNHNTAIAYRNLTHTQSQYRSDLPPFFDLAIGSLLQWDNKGWTITNVGETMIGMVGENKAFTEIPLAVFEKLVRDNRITDINLDTLQSIHPEAKKRFEQADERAYAEANSRSEIVRAYMRGDPLPDNVSVSERTLRRWVANQRKAQETYSAGYVGLIPLKKSGNTKNKLPAQTHALITEFIENDYETLKQKRKYEVYASFLLTCQRRGVIPASYKTFCKSVKRRSRYKQILKRQGRRAAYKDKEFYMELTLTTPRHGERPFHIAHIDHTLLDEELVCSLTGQNLGRAWATFMTDAFSRRLLAVYLTYDPPSYRSCMMISRECVRRFGRLPQIVIVDNGLEFSGTYFETLLAFYECTKKTRPPAESRFGSVGERLFGTTNTRFIHNLQGNTQIMRNVRQVTKSNNPREHAIWTLEKLYLYLREWAYEVYDTIEHPAIGQSPRDAFVSGMLYSGARIHRLIPYNNEFRLHTLPTTKKTTAKVQPGRGVKINNIYYWSDAFRHPEIENTQVAVRFDPWDAGLSFAYAKGRWTECYSERYAVFRGRSEREIMIATDELRKRQSRHSKRFNITAIQLAQFLESIEAEEVLLRQRAVDRESHGVLSMVDSSFQSQTAEITDYPASLQNKPYNSSFSATVSSGDSSKLLPTEVYGEF